MLDRPLPQHLARRTVRAALSLPERLLRRLVGPAPLNDRGHALDLQTQVLLRVMGGRRKSPWELGVARMRRELEWQAPVVDVPPMALHRVEDREVPVEGGAIRVRLYVPMRPTGAPQPLCVYFHGGGFVQGSLGSHDGVCRWLARRVGCLVLAVDYRMAPEHRFPVAAHDALAAFRWAQAHAEELGADPARIAVAGDSAGGNLAAVVAQQVPEGPCFQLLIYPATDLSRSHGSHRTYARGFFLEKDVMDWFVEQYLANPEREQRDPLGSPLFTGSLRGLAPAYVMTAGFDPLRDEGEAYARRLAEAGVPVAQHCEESLIHGFFSMGGVVEAARAAVERAAEALQRGLQPRAVAAPSPSGRGVG